MSLSPKIQPTTIFAARFYTQLQRGRRTTPHEKNRLTGWQMWWLARMGECFGDTDIYML